MKKSKMPDTSLDAYHSLDQNNIREIYARIKWALSNIGEGTWEDISKVLKEKDSKIWRRLAEMERLEIICRTENKKVLSSGRKGYTWKLTSLHSPTVQDHSRNIQAIINSKPQTNTLF
jgi:predicted transcriptional regulator